MKAIALMVFLLVFLTSILVHADHLLDQKTIVEQQDCHLCTQGIDTPRELPQVQAAVVTRYNPFFTLLTTTNFTRKLFIQPPLRAPPFIQ